MTKRLTDDPLGMNDGFEYAGHSESYEPIPARPLTNEELRDARRYFRFHADNARAMAGDGVDGWRWPERV
jgi:hypothetical protein